MIASFFDKLSFVRKIITMLVAISSISILITSFAFISLEYVSAQHHLKQHLQLLNEMVAENIVAAVAFEDNFAISESLAILKADDNIVYVKVTDASGNLMADYGEFDSERQKEEEYYITADKTLFFDGENVGNIHLIASKNDFNSRITVYFLIALLVFISAIGIAILLSIFMHRHLSAPILQLSKTTKEITDSNNYALRVNITDSDEVGDLANAFNTMLNQVETRKDQLEDEVKSRTSQLELANEKLSKLAFYDNLTGLPNRVLLEDRLKQAIIRNQREQRVIALLFIDLDGFKAVNDTYGHAAGDAILTTTASYLLEQGRELDTVARLGGDEFIMLLELRNNEDISVVCTRIINSFNLKMADSEVNSLVTLSIGAAIYGEDSSDFETLKHQADTAMYQVKQEGKNGFQVYRE